MTSNSVSSLGLQLLSVGNLQNEQFNLAQLGEQLATGQKFDNLTQYDPTAAHNIMSFQNTITQKQAYLASIQTVQTRLTMYDQTMTDMENIVGQASALASNNQSLNTATVGQLQAQVQAYLKQVGDDLNQNIGGRYIYAGTRYTTAPVIDLSVSAATPAFPFTATTTPTLPTYDSEYNPPTTTTDAAAFTQDSVTVDNNFSVQYGVTSNDPAFQQIIAGLQFMNVATKSGVSAATYQTDMQNAVSLLTSGLTAVQTLHAGVASNQNILTNETTTQNTNVSNLQIQLTNLQAVNITEVGASITALQTQLQASYSATATIEQLSILKYL